MSTRVFLVFGLPGTGKSTFCSLYCDQVKNSVHFNLDAVFLSEFYKGTQVPDIAQHIDSGSFDKKLFMETFEHDFTLWMWFKKQSPVQDILIEGYELYFVEKEMRDLLANLNVDEVVKIELENYQFYYKGRRIPIVLGSDFKDVVKAIVEEDCLNKAQDKLSDI